MLECSNCFFGKDHTIKIPYETPELKLCFDNEPRIKCRRFPKFETKHLDDWCGEYQWKDKETFSNNLTIHSILW